MRCYSGSFIRAEVRRGRAERVYLDFFPDEQTEAFLRLSEQLEKMLSEQLAGKNPDHALGNHSASGFLFFWENRPFPGKKREQEGRFPLSGDCKTRIILL